MFATAFVLMNGTKAHCTDFLVLSPSVRAWGMGGAGGAIAEPFSAYLNAGGLGVYALGGVAGVSHNTSDWLPDLSLDIEYKNTLVFAGAPLFKDVGARSPRLTFAAAYHRKTFEYTTGTFSDEFGHLWSIRSFERSNNVTAAFGLEYGVEVGVGVTLKWAKAVYEERGSGVEQSSLEGTGTGRDAGIFVRAPVLAMLRKFEAISYTPEAGRVNPEIIVSAGQCWQNRGGEMKFHEGSQGDDLPAVTRSSAAARAHIEYDDCLLVAFTFAADHEKHHHYENELDRVGWELDLLGAFALRGGHYDQTESPQVDTKGLSFHLVGVTRWLGKVAFDNSPGGAPWYLEHIDVYYQRADVDDDGDSSLRNTDMDEYGVTVSLPAAGIF